MKLKSESVGTEERGIKLALEVSSAKNHFVLNRGQSTHTIQSETNGGVFVFFGGLKSKLPFSNSLSPFALLLISSLRFVSPFFFFIM